LDRELPTMQAPRAGRRLPESREGGVRVSRTSRIAAPGVDAFRLQRGEPATGRADRTGEHLVATHCCFCGVQCGMFLRVSGAGANIGECFPVTTQYFWGARDRGAKLITVDPQETPLARTADLNVPLRPGTDAAFFNGVLHVVERQGRIDEDFVARRTVGWETT